MTARGRFIVFEGVDGCGKTTQVRRVAAAIDGLATFEPGDTEFGVALRAVVLDETVAMTPLAEVLLMAADRAQHVAQVLEPTLSSGRHVVCDRFSGSTLAYQGFGRGVDLEVIRHVVSDASGGLVPDATVLLDCPPEVAVARRGNRASSTDRFEGSDAAFAARVRDGFLAIAGDDATWHVIDASRSVGQVSADVDRLVAGVVG